MTGDVGMALLPAASRIPNTVLHLNSTVGTLSGTSILWHLLPSTTEAINQRTHVPFAGSVFVWPRAGCYLPTLFERLSEAVPLKSALWAATPHSHHRWSICWDWGLLSAWLPLSSRHFHQGHLRTLHRQKMAEIAAVRFASCAIPSTSKLEASWLLKTGGIQHCLPLWGEMLWEQCRERHRGEGYLRWGENSMW